MRARMSVVPPGGYGTTHFTGRFGYCAEAVPMASLAMHFAGPRYSSMRALLRAHPRSGPSSVSGTGIISMPNSWQMEK